ncbi:MAG TPA: DegT/DnrJ/EryC1/StrS family aminotransferase [Candidatus Kapabacteria bacterium]|nr:DegT/DnrJ/EryC1/StrS family aminotransferase [Candidatus Kapabacteria bacterium]
MLKIKPFKKPILITRPILPDLDEVRNEIEKAWKSRWITNNGFRHQELEKKLKKVLKIPHISLFNNGTIALMTAVRSLKLSGEVITTPFTFAATPHVLSWNGLSPVFCDIDPITMNIDVDKIEALITHQTSAILAVHVFGTPCDVKKIEMIARRHKLKVVYDAAHAFGVEIDGKGIGENGDMTMYSFHATKLFHTGEGGALASKKDEIKKYIDVMKNFGIENENKVSTVGINGKMNELQASLGIVVLKYMKKEREARKKIEVVYRKNLRDMDGIELLPEFSGVKKSFQYFVIRINAKQFGRSRDFVYQELKQYNVFARKYFYPLCSQYGCYSNLPSAQNNKLPVANAVVREVLALPFYGGLKIEDVEKICDIIRSLKK